MCRGKKIPEEYTVRTERGDFLVNVGVFDLYPKPVSTIEKHVSRRSNIEKIYSNVQSS